MTETPLSELIDAQFADLRAENATLQESLEDVRRSLQFEDRGWSLIGALSSGENIEGLTLEEVKEISAKIRPYVAGASLVGRGVRLHTGYAWARGVHIDGAVRTKTRGTPSGLQRFFADPVNQSSLFSAAAHGKLQKTRYADGTVFAVCDASARQVRLIPISEITGVRVNPDYVDEVWAYQRTWTPDEATQPKVRWYYTHRFTGRRQGSFTSGGVTVQVAAETIIDRGFNRLTGWPLGIPDATAAMPWYHAYAEIMRYGRVVNESLAKILYKIISNTKKGAENAAVKVAGMSGHGNSASMVEGQDVQAVSTAGKGYEFTTARPVAAMMAAALDVPNIELLSDSSAAGSSYGAAAQLGPSTINAMKLIQAEWAEFYGEIFEFFGLGSPEIQFPPIVEADAYREAQRLGLFWQFGVLKPEEARGEALEQLKLPGDKTDYPEGIMVPNNINSGARTDVDPNGSSFVASTPQAASPDQGRSNGSGGETNTMQTLPRRDTVSEALAAIQLDDLRELVERLEIAKAQ